MYFSIKTKNFDEKKIRNELDYLNISVKKTGSYKELRSWKKLKSLLRIILKTKKENSPQLLISFRDIKEISDKNFKYFDICDLKDPEKGSIGAWEEKNILKVIKRSKQRVEVSATIGDIFSVEGIIKKLQQFDNLGLDYIKFGINTRMF